MPWYCRISGVEGSADIRSSDASLAPDDFRDFGGFRFDGLKVFE